MHLGELRKEAHCLLHQLLDQHQVGWGIEGTDVHQQGQREQMLLPEDASLLSFCDSCCFRAILALYGLRC